MATEPHSPPPPPSTPVHYTTRRGIATASFSLATWGTLVFWWYPFGMMIASLGVAFGLIALAMGFKARVDGRYGENLAAVGVVIGSIGVGAAVTVYRFMQLAFEGAPTADWYAFPQLF
jgi:hypothetical protein